ncbi:MAG: DinB family protein [Anaerolineae bacterium]|nr:DinB family protein [Anaerolineae bacterium]
MLDYIHLLMNYSRWAHHKTWDCLATVSDEDFGKPIPYSVGSLHQQMVHVMWAEDLWFSRVHQLPRPDHSHLTLPRRTDVRAAWDAVEGRWKAYVDGITEEELNRVVTFMRGNGEQLNFPVWQIIVHMVNHGTDHRGQILRIVHDMGGETFEQDMFFYLREQQFTSQ